MKKSLLTVFTLAFAFAVGPALAEDEQDTVKQPKKRSDVAPAPPRRVNPAPRTVPQTSNVKLTPRFQRFQNRVNQPPTNRVDTPRAQAPPRTFNPPDQDAVRPTTTARTDVDLTNSNWRNRTRREIPPTVTTPPAPTTDTTVQSNTTVESDTTVRNRDWRNRDRDGRNRDRDGWNRDRNWRHRDRNRDWQNNTSGTFTYDQARRRHHRQRHHRNWWRSRYSRIALFAGGYYYWDSGYWYPAYGYDPYYSTYTYDEPIYGYGNLTPGQVIANVQRALQEQGYYDDAVDGLIGPRTRAALSDFQRDNGLPITAAIDGPTLKALGLY